MAILKRLFAIALAAVLTPAGGAFSASPAYAENAKELQAGRELAITLCSPCHIVPEQASESRSSPPTGPSFAEIAKGPRATAEALRGFLRSTQSSVAHPGAMPNPQLTEKQIDAIAAYLSSLGAAK